jgi:murein DD-endopeptidase MepM/ murein hydrolase activator NlpD
MNVLGDLQLEAARVSRASLVATFAASLVFSSISTGMAADDVLPEEVRAAAQRLLGGDDEETRYATLQPFTRELAIAGTVAEMFDSSLTEAGVPAAAMLEAREALVTSLDLSRDVRAGDRFYVRYEQTFTAEGVPIGVGRALWAEVRTRAKSTVSIHRFRTHDKTDRFWLPNGQQATPPSMRLPLEIISVSSGFGIRADPFDQPPPFSAIGKPVPLGDTKSRVLPVAVSANGSKTNVATPLGASLGLAPRPGLMPPARLGFRTLFMHEGVDLAAPVGTPVYAASDGIVVGAAPNGGYGNWIRMDHPGKLATVYGHLSEFAPGIESGVQVSQGELIGFVGSTGRSTGAHLHFEILKNGKAVDPLTFPEARRAQLVGSDLERFRKQVKRALAERDRETAVALIP